MSPSSYYNRAMSTKRHYSAADHAIIGLSDILNTLFVPASATRPFPGKSSDAELTEAERKASAGYMRVNHVGEVCAQALYQSQALTAKNPETREKMQQAAAEETDHLAWCEQRLEELNDRKSVLNPIWYSGSFVIGSLAGLAGDKWNLGFVAETERQVVAHLEDHLTALPESDQRSREVVSQMRDDEAAHAEMAVSAGAASLPSPLQGAMRMVSRIMTRTAYWL